MQDRYAMCIEYECAQDLYTLVRAHYMRQIYEEESRQKPSQALIQALMGMQKELYQEQRALVATDVEAVSRAIDKYAALLKRLRSPDDKLSTAM